MSDKYRMYGLVPYNLSPIQQGIQFGHAVQEYNNIYDDSAREGYMLEDEETAFNEWKHECKTFIILNGGTTNTNPERLGTINQHWEMLKKMDTFPVIFKEPDLGDQITAVIFLVDERVYNKKKYPDYYPVDMMPAVQSDREYYSNLFGDDADKILDMREFLTQFKLA